MSTLIWILKGPAAGQFMEVSEEDAERAEGEGWAEKAQGRDGNGFTAADAPGKHAKAEAFLAARHGYATRELRPEPKAGPDAAEKPAQEPKKPDEEAKPAEEKPADEETPQTQATKPAPKPAAKRK
jgi:hypothetical protein